MRDEMDVRQRYQILEEDFKIQNKKAKEAEESYRNEIENLRRIIKSSNQDTWGLGRFSLFNRFL